MSGVNVDAIASRFERASEEVTEERRQVVDERNALAAFAEQVRGMDLPQVQSRGVPAGLTRCGSGDGTEAVRDAYESTVMAVPHYETEYGESYERHLAEEFGPNVASMLIGGQSFRDRHRELLLQAVSTSRERREQLIEVLRTEEQSLSETTPVLLSVAEDLVGMTGGVETRDADLLDAYARRLDVLEENCTRTLERRQSTLVHQRRDLGLSLDAFDLPTYLYAEFDVTYPVVSTIADLLDRLERLRTDIHRTLEYRSASRQS
ncbi:hypothetical protein BRC65_03950 [Halobacteriales archaeon QH_2_65_14]|nr:MAG: hypothetical protein BRC65_03950 [Halobacteriales archaeon QH_2_65_14]